MAAQVQLRGNDVAARRGLPDKGMMARSLKWLFAAGATISLFTLVFPAAHADVRRIATVSICGYAMAIVIAVGGRRLPRWSFQVFLAAATMLIEWNIWATHDATSPYAAFYFWIAIYAFYFLRRIEAAIQTAFIVAAYASLLLLGPDATSTPVLRWAITMSALVVAGAMIGLLQDQLGKLAASVRFDTASGLLNRRGFHEELETEVERARRNGSSLSVIAAQVDAGGRTADWDGIFAEIGPELATLGRAGDRFARLADDELAVIVPETDADGAVQLAERIRRYLKQSRAKTKLALGVATFPQHGATTEALMHAAEQAVKAAQQIGGDRSVAYSSEIASLVLAAESRALEDRDDSLAAVLALTEVLDIRDAGTAVHSQTVGRYAESLAAELGLSQELVDRVRLAGILHDVGKIAVPDAVLRKPGALDDEEFEQMKRHPEVGALIVEGAGLKDIASWVMAHHERLDGRGYPRGLSADAIPLEARILAVADSYEAMTCDRIYRRAMSHAAARAELERCAGTQFDPRLVELFIGLLEREEGLEPLPVDVPLAVPAAGAAH